MNTLYKKNKRSTIFVSFFIFLIKFLTINTDFFSSRGSLQYEHVHQKYIQSLFVNYKGMINKQIGEISAFKFKEKYFFCTNLFAKSRRQFFYIHKSKSKSVKVSVHL